MANLLHLPRCTIDLITGEVERPGLTTKLGTKERAVLRLLVDNLGQVVSRETLLQEVWNWDPETPTRVVDNVIRALRKAIEPVPDRPVYIHALHGEGYRFTDKPPMPRTQVTLLTIPGGTLDVHRGLVTLEGEERVLTANERDVLTHLLEADGALVSRQDLSQAVWRRQTRAVDHTLRRLREKVELDSKNPTLLQTVRGQGFRINVPRAPLPAAPKPLLGRETEIREISSLLEHTRWLTITGIDGLGKTSLIEALAHEWPEGQTLFCSFTGDEDLDALWNRIIAAAEGTPGTDLWPQVVRILQDKSLVILDNAPDGATSAVRQMVDHATIVITRPRALKHDDETVYRLRGLEAEAGWTVLQRAAQRARPMLAPCPPELQARILGPLDGVPLALKVAGASLKRSTWSELAARCQTTAFATSGPLFAILEQSVGQLTSAEQAALATLSVFHGGFDAAAAAAVLGPDWDEVVDRLVDHNMVDWVQVDQHTSRYRLLNAVRQLVTAIQPAAAQQNAAEHFAGFACGSESQFVARWDAIGGEQTLRREQDNLLAALAWATDNDELEMATRLGVVLLHPALQVSEALHNQLATLCDSKALGWPRLAARVAALDWKQRRPEAAAQRLDAALETSPPPGLKATLLGRRALVWQQLGDNEQARETQHLAATTAAAVAPSAIAAYEATRMVLYAPLEDGMAVAEEALALAQRAASPRAIHVAKCAAAVAARNNGALHQAVWAVDDAIDVAKQAGLHRNLLLASTMQIWYRLLLGDVSGAKQNIDALQASPHLHRGWPIIEGDIHYLQALLGIAEGTPTQEIGTSFRKGLTEVVPGDRRRDYADWLLHLGLGADAALAIEPDQRPITAGIRGLIALLNDDRTNAEAQHDAALSQSVMMQLEERPTYLRYLAELVELKTKLGDPDAADWLAKAEAIARPMKLMPSSLLLRHLDFARDALP